MRRGAVHDMYGLWSFAAVYCRGGGGGRSTMVRVRAFLGGWCSGLPPDRSFRPSIIVHGDPIWNINFNRGMAAWPGAIRAAGPADPPLPCQN